MQTSPSERTTSGAALSFEESTEVPAPVAEVYRRWTDFTRFPEFMENVQEVRSLGGGRYHWVARILGSKQEWDAEVTDQQENHRISWRSLSGAPNNGTVMLQPMPNNRTRVQLRLEYTPPGGAVGQRIEKLTQVTRREVKEDLENFRRLISGEKKESEEMPGFGRVISSLAIPLATGAVGGAVAYLVERNQQPMRSRIPMRRQVISDAVAQPAGIASGVLITAAAGSIIASATLRARRDRTNALFVGQWAPTFLGGSILARMIGHRGVNPSLPASVASWACAGASAGSIVSSVITHLRSNRHDGLFVGQWAPTFLAGALVARLFNR